MKVAMAGISFHCGQVWKLSDADVILQEHNLSIYTSHGSTNNTIDLQLSALHNNVITKLKLMKLEEHALVVGAFPDLLNVHRPASGMR